MVKSCTRIALVLAMLLPALVGQSLTGTLTGTVTDTTGAVIPGASVVVTNNASGDIRRTVSNGEGYFTVSSLPAATYTVMVNLSGFSQWKLGSLILNSGDTKTVNARLEVAGSTETVQVVGNTAQLATVDSGEKSALITSAELQNLSIIGRNAGELLKILPGAALTANGGVNRPAYSGEVMGINGAGIGGTQGSLGNVSINASSPDITQDGGHTFDPGSPGAATPVNPNTDMVAEVKVLTSNFNAENAKGPVVMNTVSKSGGRDFHGEGYLYGRNAALNATDWFNNYTSMPKPDSSYYFPGGNIGGPVFIPGTNFNKGRDKLFFFQGFEYYKQTIDGGVMRAFVPTDAMRAGDFSGVAALGQLQGNLGTVPTAPGIVNGKIPTNMIDPGGKVMLNLYPVANADPLTNNGYNFKQSLLVPQNSWQSLTRVDYSVSDNTKIFVRYNAQREVQNMPTGLWGGTGSDNMVPAPTNIVGSNASDSWAVSMTHVFSPTMTSETSFGYTYIDFPNSPEDGTKLLRKDAGYPYKGIYGNDTLPAVLSWGGGIPNLGTPGNSFHPQMIAEKGIPSVSENLAKVFGTHTTKYGVYFEHMYNRQDNWGQYNGTFEYEPWASFSGNTYADILMGAGFNSYYELKAPPLGSVGENQLGFYLQDSWKVTRRLTLEYGVRFDHLGMPYDQNGIGMAVFNPATYSNDPAQLNAHTGLSWNAMDSSVPLSGVPSRSFFISPRFGMAYDLFGNGKTVLRGGWGKYRSIASINSGAYTSPQGTAMGSTSFWCGFNQANCPTWGSIDALAAANAGGASGPGTGLIGISAMDMNNNEQPLTTSYSFSINQQLARGFMLETSYVGNNSKYGVGTINANSVPLGAMLNDPNGNADLYRPMTNYQGITLTEGFGISDYNSWQTTLRRNVGILSLQASYTWSKAMGLSSSSGALPDWGTKYFWGVQSGNRPHVFSAAYTINVPNVAHSNVLARGVVNGWQISGISTIQSGANLLAGAGGVNYNYAQPGITSTAALGTPDLGLQPVLVCDPRQNLAPGQYINGGCFGPAPMGQLGTGAFPYIGGPAFMNHDLSLFKNFAFNDREKLQFRFSAFNFLNHPLTSFVSGDNNLRLNMDANGKLTNPNFGYADYKYGHRVIELAVKFFF